MIAEGGPTATVRDNGAGDGAGAELEVGNAGLGSTWDEAPVGQPLLLLPGEDEGNEGGAWLPPSSPLSLVVMRESRSAGLATMTISYRRCRDS